MFSISRIRFLIERVASSDITPETVSEIFAVSLREVDSTNTHVREFEGRPDAGPFSTVSLRVTGASAVDVAALLTLIPRKEVRLTQADLAGSFAFSREDVDVNPHIPPEGTISYREMLDDRRMVILELTYRTRLLRTIAIHEKVSTEPGGG
ncbi:hypothetical protein IU486_25830 [Streptomyces gardneri]|uniref:hypothetical protein n=1 Tax=Nocardia TaxID=1817 RepID=UPI001357DB9F|nr:MULTISPECIES: hypothetical protein [Nocardia]MBF6168145.1 hypothetical protein [Streptomyces gardneri]MBF6204774.1 hypothetical protein [Streptomyces gardneri]